MVLGGGVLIGEGTDLGEPILHLVYQSLDSGIKEGGRGEEEELESGLGTTLASSFFSL